MKKFIATFAFTSLTFYLEVSEKMLCFERGSDNKIGKNYDYWCIFNNFIFENKFEAFCLLALIFFTINIFWDRVENNKTKKNIHDLIDNYLETRLSSNKLNHRITVFKEVGAWRAIIYHIASIGSCFRRLWKTKKLKEKFREFPFFGGKYLIIDARFGHPNQNVRSTILRIHSEIKDSESFTEYIYHSEVIKHTTLPALTIEEVLKQKDLESVSNRALKVRIKSYMRKSHVKSFDSLKSFSRLSQHIGGIPLFTKQKSMNKPSYVIIYDSDIKPYETVQKTFKRLAKNIETIILNK